MDKINIYFQFLVAESHKRASEADRLKSELVSARVAEKEAKEKLLSFLSATISSPAIPVSNVQMLAPERFVTSHSRESLTESNIGSHYDDNTEMSFDMNGDINDISLEIEKERTEYLAKSKLVQTQLKDLRSEIEMLKISESEFDHLHSEQIKMGENKYSTLKKALKQKFFFL